MKSLLFGVAYYDEYMPCDRLEQDVAMMKKAGINVVRIAESTWSSYEPQDGVFDFSHLDRVLDAMAAAGIQVIIGTPTYAVPTWMAAAYPEILADTNEGRRRYGHRQIMDITHPTYLFYAQRIIRKLLERTACRSCVIGYQLDNETKPYHTAGKNVQASFIKYLRREFHDDLEALNSAFGLDYWSNRINAWEDFPDVRGTINGSLGAEFEKFQRTLVDDFLQWQADIVRKYCRPDQVITHNFDLGWKEHSYGVQPEVNHLHAAQCLTIAGIDIYHPSQDRLTGAEIAFGGDLTRSLKGPNYLVLETEAQGFPQWTPYPGQLRLQAYSHIASGANSVMYWHWHSIHNACETYWKGLLSHDLQENAVYREACTIGEEFQRIGSHLVNLNKENRAAILVSNEALTALNWFPIGPAADGKGQVSYNEVVRWLYDTLYRMNVECDFIWPETQQLERYSLILVPALYAVPDAVLERLKRYTEQGGRLVVTCKTGFSNEYNQVSASLQPRILRDCLGVSYQQFTYPNGVKLTGRLLEGRSENSLAETFMELLSPQGAEVLLRYDHPAWREYAAATCHSYGRGTAVYLGCLFGQEILEKIFRYLLEGTGLLLQEETGIILRKGRNEAGKLVCFYLNYSWEERQIHHQFGAGRELLTSKEIEPDEIVSIGPWNLCIIEEKE